MWWIIIRIRYVRQTNSRKHHGPCNEQTGYTLTILNGMINDIILLQVLRYVKSVSKAEIFEAGYQAQMSEKAIVNKAQRTNRKRKNNLQHIPVPVMAGRTADLSASDESSWDLRLVLS